MSKTQQIKLMLTESMFFNDLLLSENTSLKFSFLAKDQAHCHFVLTD